MTDSGAASGGEPSTSVPTTRRYTTADVRAVCELLDLDPDLTLSITIEPKEIVVSAVLEKRRTLRTPGGSSLPVPRVRQVTTYPVDTWLDPDA